MNDVRDEIFRSIEGHEVLATIEAAEGGIVCGLESACARAKELGLDATPRLADGDPVAAGEAIVALLGAAKALTMAEEDLIGILGKASGVASATRRLVEAAAPEIRVVGGGWKKVPPQVRPGIRRAVAVGGGDGRMAEHPMVYLDKNYVRMLGGVRETLEAVRHLSDHQKVIQLDNDRGDIAAQAGVAVELGATTLLIDTGDPHDVAPVVDGLERRRCRASVTVAFGGGVTLEGLALLKRLGVEAVCVGRSIVDAPLLDLRLRVQDVRARGEAERSDGGWNLFGKTEIRIERIGLTGANLTSIARAVAETLRLSVEDVLVIDARDDVLALDVLRDSVDPYQLVGRRDEILHAVAAVEGVKVTDATDLCAEGMLGWVALEEADGRAALDRSSRMLGEIEARIAHRAIVFPTGNEVVAGQIVDTNTPLIRSRLEREGFVVDEGPALPDDRELIRQRLSEAALAEGYGLVVTTGGVGAETKDCTIEALLEVDPSASTPYICRFEKGHGRHAKDGVRIGVGSAGTATLVALPGPNDEVTLGLEAAIDGLSTGADREIISSAIASVLRGRLSQKLGERPAHASGHGSHG